MFQTKGNVEETNAVKVFKAKLAMAKLNVRKRHPTEAVPQRDASGHLTGEFDISGLPLLVKKHIITAGIIQGDVYEYGDGYACIREVFTSTGKSTSSIALHLRVQALTWKSYDSTIGVIESLVDEVLEPQNRVYKKSCDIRSWSKVLRHVFEIQDLMKPVISHLIIKGIIRGELYCDSGAVVSAKGSPYMADDLPQEVLTERPIYLLIEGPTKNNLYRAVEGIRKLIKEAEEIINNDIPKVVAEVKTQPRDDAVSTVVDLTQDSRFPPFLPQIGKNVDADVERCVALVQWLLAHPLLVSFITRPPNRGSEAKKISKNMALVLLLCFPLSDQYDSNPLNSKQMFLYKVQNAILECSERVLTEGYDICKLISVDDYVKMLATDPTQIGVLYDYPLPMNLFHLDNCRLFIDVVINCGLEIEQAHLESYLRTTMQWYPVEAFQKVTDKSRVKPCPSNNKKTHQYPPYSLTDHFGGLINFKLHTISYASPEQYFRADATKIPRCEYFPFLDKLSVFANLHRFNTNKNTNKQVVGVPSKAHASPSAQQPSTSRMSGTAPAVIQPHLQAQPSQHNSDPSWWNSELESLKRRVRAYFNRAKKTLDWEKYHRLLTEYNNAKRRAKRMANRKEIFKVMNTSGNNQIVQENRGNTSTNASRDWKSLQEASPRQKLFKTDKTGNLPSSFSTMRDRFATPQKTISKPVSNPKTNPDSTVIDNRIHRKQERKERVEKKRDTIRKKKREEIDNTIEQLREKHGSNNFWTRDPSELNEENSKEKMMSLSGTPVPNPFALQIGSSQLGTAQALGSYPPRNLQNALSMMQMSMPVQNPTFLGAQPPVQESWPPKNREQILEDGQTTPQSNRFSDVINQLQEYIEETNAKTTDKAESTDLPEDLFDEDIYAEPSSMSVSSGQTSASNVDAPQESAFSSIIQQLQQYIDSNNTSQESSQKEMLPVDVFKTPSVLDKREETKARSEYSRGQSPVDVFKTPSVPDKREETKARSEYSRGQSPVDVFKTPSAPDKREETKARSEYSRGQSPVDVFKTPSVPDKREETKARSEYSRGQSPVDVFKTPSVPDKREETRARSEYSRGQSPVDVFKTPSVPDKRKETIARSEYSRGQSTGDVFKTPSVRDKREETKARSEYSQEQLKRASETSSYISQPNRLCSDNINYTEKTPASKLPNANVQNRVEVTAGLQKQVVSFIKQPDIVPEISILGDSLLQKARSQFGGSRLKDRREDSFTMETLLKDVTSYYFKGARLNSYCVLMCGANDLASGIELTVFNQQLKSLLNFLLTRGHYLLLVTLPLVVSDSVSVNRKIPTMNGFLLSYQTKPNLSIIPFHKRFLEYENRKSLFDSILMERTTKGQPPTTAVLSDHACTLIREMIEKEVKG